MKLYKSDKIRFISGLIIIILIYSFYYIYFVENKNTLPISRKLKHAIMLLATVAVYFVGTLHLGKLKDSWMSSIWHLVHISGLSIITLLGFADWVLTNGISLSLRSFTLSVQEILISPVLYVAMGLLNKSLNRDEKPN
ncbi:hypothetical protein [Cognatitamlana onchidii]|uniref:hypothetical protein n=1 Tax=Cognatitamlana onchidii TaxID=2562860 RepID=UPI0010A67D7F|nr:hypothetical protein [Algibacter onchidii]